MGPVAKRLCVGTAAAAQAGVVTLENSAIGSGKHKAPDEFQGTVPRRNDFQRPDFERAVRFRSHGHYPRVDEADARMRAIAKWLVRRVTAAAKHNAGVVAGRASRIECKFASNNVRTVGSHIDSCHDHGWDTESAWCVVTLEKA